MARKQYRFLWISLEGKTCRSVPYREEKDCVREALYARQHLPATFVDLRIVVVYPDGKERHKWVTRAHHKIRYVR